MCVCVLCFSAGLQAFPSSTEVLLSFCHEINPPQLALAMHRALCPGSRRLLRLRSSSCHPLPEGTSRSWRCHGMHRYPAPLHGILWLPWKLKMPAALPRWQSALGGGGPCPDDGGLRCPAGHSGGQEGQGSAGSGGTTGRQQRGGAASAKPSSAGEANSQRCWNSTALLVPLGMGWKRSPSLCQRAGDCRGEVSPGLALFDVERENPFYQVFAGHVNRTCKPRSVSGTSATGLPSTGTGAPLKPGG